MDELLNEYLFSLKERAGLASWAEVRPSAIITPPEAGCEVET
jgi:hypothetical protein